DAGRWFAREGRRGRVLRPHVQDGRRPTARRGQDLRARRGTPGRRSEELSLSEGYRARLPRGADVLGLQPPESEREADVRMRLLVRGLIGAMTEADAFGADMLAVRRRRRHRAGLPRLCRGPAARPER